MQMKHSLVVMDSVTHVVSIVKYQCTPEALTAFRIPITISKHQDHLQWIVLTGSTAGQQTFIFSEMYLPNVQLCTDVYKKVYTFFLNKMTDE